MEIRIDIKPLSVNRAWQGRRFKSPEYARYEREMLLRLPPAEIPEPPLSITYEFGFSNMRADYDNPCKPLGDILQKRYGFDDCLIEHAEITKRRVPKGQEYVSVRLEHWEPPRR